MQMSLSTPNLSGNISRATTTPSLSHDQTELSSVSPSHLLMAMDDAVAAGSPGGGAISAQLLTQLRDISAAINESLSMQRVFHDKVQRYQKNISSVATELLGQVYVAARVGDKGADLRGELRQMEGQMESQRITFVCLGGGGAVSLPANGLGLVVEIKGVWEEFGVLCTFR